MTLRYGAILFASVLAVHAGDLASVLEWGRRAEAAQSAESRHVILVVADGLRWQEVFRGADSAIVFGDRALAADGSPTRVKYWRPAMSDRRAALMPFLWSTVAGEGVLLGSRDAGSEVRVTNGRNFSYPGYNEMLVGYPDRRINSNEVGRNPNVTVFEWLNRRVEFRGRVAAFGMWDTFNDIFNAPRSRVPVMDFATDAELGQAALRYLEERQPRAMFVGFGATDDLAHQERYELVLDAAHAIDGYLEMLWSAAQSHPDYRGRTTLIVVADHGRGRTPRDWMNHNHDVPGADETWMAVIGPEIPGAGEIRGEFTLAQVAGTVAASVGLDYSGQVRRAAPPLALGAHR